MVSSTLFVTIGLASYASCVIVSFTDTVALAPFSPASPLGPFMLTSVGFSLLPSFVQESIPSDETLGVKVVPGSPLSPFSPCAPVSPLGPTAPVGPVAPVGPCKPCGPLISPTSLKALGSVVVRICK